MKIRKELWFGFTLMAMIVAGAAYILLSADKITNGHLGLLMLSLVVVAIMLGFPTAFTLMGMGMIFTWFAYDRSIELTLTLMVQSAFRVMSNDVLISIPLFVFMGYLVERANLIEKLFASIHLALARVPGSLAVATLMTCAVFATATGIVGAVVTLMGLLALPQMLRNGYDEKLAAGAITAGGCLGILIPPSVLLIVYGATAGVSVVQLYAAALFPGMMLTALYLLYVILLAKLKPSLAPPLPLSERIIPLPVRLAALAPSSGTPVVPGLVRAIRGIFPTSSVAMKGGPELAMAGGPLLATPSPSRGYALGQFGVALLPVMLFLGAAWVGWNLAARPVAGPAAGAAAVQSAPAGLTEPGGGAASRRGGGLAEPPGSGADAEPAQRRGGLAEPPAGGGLAEPPAGGGLAEPPGAGSLAEPPGAGGLAEPPGAGAVAESRSAGGLAEPPGAESSRRRSGGGGLAEPGAYAEAEAEADTASAAQVERVAPTGYWIGLVVGLVALIAFYRIFSFARFELFKRLLASFFPLVILIAAVLGSIVMGLATPTEAAAVGALGGAVLAACYGRLTFPVLKESTFLAAKTSAMVCWLFVGSAIFSAAFALLGGQELVENWVLSMDLTKTQFLILTQVIIFILGWPLEWTEIIVIFMPIFIPLLDHFDVDPLFFGLLVALNLQTAFLSPPVAMAAFYLRGVSPPHVTLNKIFLGMIPFMGIQILAIVIMYLFPEIGLWLPRVLYAP